MRNKRLRRALFAAPLLLLLLAAWWPFTKVRLGRDTTYVTSPLAADGLPNFSLAILDKYRTGVTNENNAARPFWQAIGPRDLGPGEYEAICKDLNLEIDLTGPFLVDVADRDTAQRLNKWIAEQTGGSDQATAEDAEMFLRTPFDAASSFKTRPWTDEQLPPLAAWLAENQRPLDLLVEASRRPRFFSPPPNALLDPNASVIDLELPHAEFVRDAVRSLSTRAMNRLGHGDHVQAWQDVLACWRLGQLVGNGPTLTEAFVGISTRAGAMNATLAILDSPDLPHETAQEILRDLQSLESRHSIVESVNVAERLSLIDSGLRVTTGRLGGVGDPAAASMKQLSAFDANHLLQSTNAFFDRTAAVVALNEWQIRDDELDKHFSELDSSTQKSWFDLVHATFSSAKRSQIIGNNFLQLTAPALRAAVDAHKRDECNLILVRVAAALAIYRNEYGVYPDSLDQLTQADVLKELPNDPFAAAPFHYERRNEGYLLYSLSENRRDDGGADMTHPIVAGEWVDEEELGRPVADASDLVIRLPLPPLELPFEPKPAEPSPE